MEIWPAIDLRGGKCVRLQQGDYARETVFGDDPVAMAQHWVAEGAERLHLVDLDGARDGRPANLEAVRSIVRQAGVPCELGGGIRTAEAIEELLELGLVRLVLGTRALREPEWFADMCRQVPGALALGIDARDGRVAVDGWTTTSGTPAIELARSCDHLPLAAVVYTDIARDGMLHGPNVAAMAEMKDAIDYPVIASGGVSCVADVARLAEVGLDGCIIGRALYEGAVVLGEAIAASRPGRAAAP
jgi:phosphoribosylformimino-5-aminoimidazole carboxamide ribotide isomerase